MLIFCVLQWVTEPLLFRDYSHPTMPTQARLWAPKWLCDDSSTSRWSTTSHRFLQPPSDCTEISFHVKDVEWAEWHQSSGPLSHVLNTKPFTREEANQRFSTLWAFSLLLVMPLVSHRSVTRLKTPTNCHLKRTRLATLALPALLVGPWFAKDRTAVIIANFVRHDFEPCPC